MENNLSENDYCGKHDALYPWGSSCPMCDKVRTEQIGQVFGPRPGTKYVAPPIDAGKPVSMIVFKDRLYIAFEYGVYRWNYEKEWEQILVVHRKEGMAVGP